MTTYTPGPGQAYERIRRTYLATCPRCNGRGVVPTKRGWVPCPEGCDHGSVERHFIEIVAVDETEQASK